MNKLQKIVCVGAGVISLALGAGKVYAQTPSELYKTWDGIFVSSPINPLPRDKDVDVDSYISGGNVTSFTVYDSIPFLKGKINGFLKESKRAKNFYNSKEDKATQTKEDENRLREINMCEELLTKVSKEKRTPEYYKSLEKLAKALSVKDHVITTKELEGVLGGVTYVIDKKGIDPIKGVYDAPMLVYFQQESAPTQVVPIPVPIPTPEASLPQRQPKENLPLTEPQVPKEKPKQEIPVQPKPQKQEKDYRGVSILTQGIMNGTADAYGASLGLRVNPFQNADIGFGVNLDLGFGLDKVTDSYNDEISGKCHAPCPPPLPPRIYTSGSTTEQNKLSIGGSLEAQFGPFIIGGGIDYKSWITDTVAKITKDGKVTKSNSDSTPNRQVFGKVYGGFEFPVSDSWKIGAIGGYNGRDGGYFGIRTAIKLK